MAELVTALESAKERLEEFVILGETMCIHGVPQCINEFRGTKCANAPEDPELTVRRREVFRRLLREVEVCARAEAVEQWTSGRPF